MFSITLNGLMKRLLSYLRYIYFPNLLPLSCLLCLHTTDSSINICAICMQNLPFITNHCQKCGLIIHSESSTITICGICLKNPPPVEQTYPLFHYSAPITQFMTRLKFHHQLVYAGLLGYFFCQHIENIWYQHQPLPDLIIPIPLHSQRLQTRGFNQALEIARPIAKKFNLPIDKRGCIRHRATDAQSGLNAKERKKNLTHAFSTDLSYQGLSIAILDDVMTTGQTIFELASLLKQRGAKQVVAWCAARATLSETS